MNHMIYSARKILRIIALTKMWEGQCRDPVVKIWLWEAWSWRTGRKCLAVNEALVVKSFVVGAWSRIFVKFQVISLHIIFHPAGSPGLGGAGGGLR